MRSSQLSYTPKTLKQYTDSHPECQRPNRDDAILREGSIAALRPHDPY